MAGGRDIETFAERVSGPRPRGGLLALILGVAACSSPASPPTPRPVPPPPPPACEQTALAEADAAAREGRLDRRGRVLDAARVDCKSAALTVALVEAWVEQGRFEAASHLLESPGHGLSDASRARLSQALARAKAQDLTPERHLAEARAAVSEGQHAAARRHFDQALARLSAGGVEPRLIVSDAAVPHRRDDSYMGPVAPHDDGSLRFWPARDLQGQLGALVADADKPGRPFLWLEGGAQSLGQRVVFAEGVVGRVGEAAVQGKPARAPVLSPSARALAWLAPDGVEVVKMPALSRLLRIATRGHGASYQWLDEQRLLIRNHEPKSRLRLLDVRRGNKPVAEVHGYLVTATNDGAVLAAVGADDQGDALWVVDGASGREKFRAPVRVAGDVPALTTSPDGKEVVFLPGDGTAVVFSTASGARRTVGAKRELAWNAISATSMTDDGWVCVDARYGHGSRCELAPVVNVRRRTSTPSEYQRVCLRSEGKVASVLLPTGAQTPGRRRVRSANGPGRSLCASAYGTGLAVWLEGKEVGEGPIRSTSDVVVVAWDTRARRVRATIPLDGVRFDNATYVGALRVEGDQVRGELGTYRFVADVATGTARVESVAERADTIGGKLNLVELSSEGFARSELGHVVDLRPEKSSSDAAGATFSPGGVRFRGIRYELHDGDVRLRKPNGERIGRLTALGGDLRVVAYSDGRVELLGEAWPALACAFRRRVTEFDVCRERLIVQGRYATLLAP